MSKYTRNRPPFGEQSRRRRNRKYIGVKNRIRHTAPILGGRFTTHDYLHGGNGWMDALFLGRKAPAFYCLALQTTWHAYKEAVFKRASRLFEERFPEAASPYACVWDRKTRLYQPHGNDAHHYPELVGMTRSAWEARQSRLIANSGEVQVHEEWKLLRNYTHGIGLHASIDAPFLTIDAINIFITRFLRTEADFRDPTPRSYRYEQIPSWGMEMSTLIDYTDSRPISEVDDQA
ncbi:MAG: hypothetical protein IT532_11655 [Burkholderiales bacterium]|nr:hypothetical protein [Burkholderiales bacterium]